MSRTAQRLFSLDLDAVMQIKLPNPIQVQKRGARRLPTLSESLAMVLGALGTLNRLSGVKALNTEINGKPVALALIENANFAQDSEGNTRLDPLE